MAEPHYHLFAPTLSPEFDGALLGRDVLARNRASGQAVILKSFRAPWRSVLTDDQKDILRQARHPALVGFLRTEPSLQWGLLYAYHAYQFETLAEAIPVIRDEVGYEHNGWIERFADVAEALHLLAQTGVHHGALNPESIVLTRTDGRIRVKDVGLAIRLGDDVNESLRALRPAFPYLAPEVFDALVQGRDAEPSLVADVYSLGAVMHEFFFGRPLVEVEQPHLDTRTVILKVLEGRIDLAEDWQQLPILTAVLHRCLHPDPAMRYGDFATLAADLRAAATSILEFLGEDAFGLRFQDAHGVELRVLPPHLTMTPVPRDLQQASGLWLVPQRIVDAGTRTVVQSDLSGLVPRGEGPADPVFWEYHFVQGMRDLAMAATAVPFVSHPDLLWRDLAFERLYWLYPTLRPRAGEETAFLTWLAELAAADRPAVVAPEVWQHAQALVEERTAVSFDEVDEPAALATGVYVFARLVYAGLTHVPLPTEFAALLAEVPLAYYKESAVSVQFSEILAGCLRPDPAERMPSADAVLHDYEQRQTRSGNGQTARVSRG